MLTIAQEPPASRPLMPSGCNFEFCSEEHSFSFSNLRVSLGTKHRFSITFGQSWCGLQSNREVGVLCVPVPGLTTFSWPNTVSRERRIDPKKIIVEERSLMGKMAWRKWPMIFFFFEERDCKERD